MNEPRYIKISEIYKRLRVAEKEQLPIYIHALTGCGKTAAVQYFYRKEKVLWLTGKDGSLDDMPEEKSIREDIVILDDLSFLTDTNSQEYVCSLLRSGSKHLVLIGRCVMPAFLISEHMSGRLLACDENVFLLQETDIGRLAVAMGLSFEPKTAAELYAMIKTDTAGYYPFVHEVLSLMAGGRKYDEGLREEAFALCCRYFDRCFFEMWKPELRNLLLSLADFETFTEDMAVHIALEPRTELVLEYAVSVGDFIRQEKTRIYRMRFFLQKYLLWKRKIIWKGKKEKEIYHRACIYYWMKERYDEALRFAKLSGDTDELQELLIIQSGRNPGTAHFYESRKYYLDLSEEVIKCSPALMSGMSMLQSLLLHPEESERWYLELERYGKDKTLTKLEKKEISGRLAYLSIALPHRGITGIIETIKNAVVLKEAKELDFPEFSVTSNLPSLMNGGKDFSEWSKRDTELAKTMRIPVEMILGKYGAGLVEIALAESGFEKQSREPYDIISLLQTGIDRAGRYGKQEMCFAGTGVFIKLHVSQGHAELAENLLKDFEKGNRREEHNRLYPNIAALKTWLALLDGKLSSVREWLETAPSENTDFNILDRYQYMVKIRSLIALERYEEAWSLSVKLDQYFTEYHRTYYDMENQLLQAVISYRCNREQWKELFPAAVMKAREYHFVWLVAQEGAAVLPLIKDQTFLNQIKTIGLSETDEYIKAVVDKAERMAKFYPEYLKALLVPEETLTRMEQRILKLYSDGMSTEDIQTELGITWNTLKFHNRNLYHKLGVKNRQQAVGKAAGILSGVEKKD